MFYHVRRTHSEIPRAPPFAPLGPREVGAEEVLDRRMILWGKVNRSRRHPLITAVDRQFAQRGGEVVFASGRTVALPLPIRSL